MKKLMIAAVAITCTMIANAAASFDWKTNMGQQIYVSGTTTKLESGTAYIFDAGSVSQLSLLQNFFATGKMASGSLHSKAVSSGTISATSGEAFTWGKSAGETLNAYIALINEDEIFISGIKSGVASDGGYTQLKFDCKTASQTAASELQEKPTSFAGAGWYAASVPEPTSGLLMLLGMAGLALKRRRA